MRLFTSSLHPRSFFAALLVLCAVPEVRGQVYEKVYSFTDALAAAPNRGSNQSGELLMASDGYLYGTTGGGGVYGGGTIFKVSLSGVLTTLVDFNFATNNTQGRFPKGTLVEGADGLFYGVTTHGGVPGYGTVFKMTRAGALTTLVQFTGESGASEGDGPTALVQAGDGMFYGTTAGGGPNNFGTVFRMTAGGAITTMVEFTGNSGAFPGRYPSSLMVAGNGDLYGTTTGGAGTIFRLTTSGAFTPLVQFVVNDPEHHGTGLEGTLTEGSDGKFYGTTGAGGLYDKGTVFRMTPSGTLTTLFHFDGASHGSNPTGRLAEGSDGSFFGSTGSGGG